MRKITTLILGIAAALLLVCAANARAQTVKVTNPVRGGITDTNPPGITQQFWDKLTGTNLAGVVGAAFADGGKKVLFADVIYNFNENVAAIVGYDVLFKDKLNLGSDRTANVVRGGLSLKTALRPLKNWGYENFVLYPYLFDLIATPTSGTDNDGGLANIAGGGVDWKFRIYKQLDGHLGGIYMNRAGQGDWDGNYFGGYGGISCGNPAAGITTASWSEWRNYGELAAD